MQKAKLLVDKKFQEAYNKLLYDKTKIENFDKTPVSNGWFIVFIEENPDRFGGL